MRRVLHIIDSFDHSEAASQLAVLARGLANEGFRVEIAALAATQVPHPCRDGSRKSSSENAIPIPIIPLGRRFVHDPLTLLRLALLVQRFKPDVVHTWDLTSATYASAVLTRLPQRWRDRLRAWGLGPRRPRHILGLYRIEPWKPEWQWFLVRRLARFADQLVTSSRKVRDWYADRGLPTDSFSPIGPVVPAARPSDVSREELLRELELPSDAKLIGVVGRLVPENRVKDLIWAADLLRVLHNNLRLLVIGDGPLRSQLEEYARLASDLDHIQFLGDRTDVWRILPHLNVLWHGGENVGPSTVILQAMAAGVPVVAGDTPTNRELVVENNTGYLIPLGVRSGRADRARYTDRIFTDAELAARLSRAAHQHAAEQFGIERGLAPYWELYSRLCQ